MAGHREETDRHEAGSAHTADGGRPGAWEHLSPGVVRHRLPHWDATAGAVLGTRGALVVDTGSSLGEGAWIGAEIRRLSGLAVTQVVLTHPHFDHVLGTAAFTAAVTAGEVYGPAGMDLTGAREELRRDAVLHGLPPGVADESATASASASASPRHTVADSLTLTAGGRRVLLVNLGPAHSAHDLAALVRGADGGPDVVFCGDLVEESGQPQAGPDACPSRWPAALDRLLSLGGEDAVYVPGHGAAVDARFVRAQRDVLARRFAGS